MALTGPSQDPISMGTELASLLYNHSFSDEREKRVLELIHAGASLDVGIYDRRIPAEIRVSQAALHFAAHRGQEVIVRALLNAGANIELRDVYLGNPNRKRDLRVELTPLLYAALGGHEKVINLLIEHGADINANCSRLRGALHYAAFSGNIKILETLLALKLDMEARDYRDQTPLFCAVSANRTEAVVMLLKRGACLNLVNSNNQTPLFAGLWNARTDTSSKIIQIIKGIMGMDGFLEYLINNWQFNATIEKTSGDKPDQIIEEMVYMFQFFRVETPQDGINPVTQFELLYSQYKMAWHDSSTLSLDFSELQITSSSVEPLILSSFPRRMSAFRSDHAPSSQPTKIIPDGNTKKLCELYAPKSA